jgi:predicted flap endonuclease-1-like 5' DNA nuclease
VPVAPASVALAPATPVSASPLPKAFSVAEGTGRSSLFPADGRPGASPREVPPTIPSPGAEVTFGTLPRGQASAMRGEAARAQELAAEVLRVQKELSVKSADIHRLTSERNVLRVRAGRAGVRVQELESALRVEAALRSELVDTHTSGTDALRQRITQLEAQLQARAATDSKLTELEQKLTRVEQKLAERDETIEQLKTEIQKGSVPPPPPPADAEGLLAIRGIGPRTERALRAAGVSGPAAIAAWTPEDIAQIAPRIKVKVERIVREDWVGQAQKLVRRASAPE